MGPRTPIFIALNLLITLSLIYAYSFYLRDKMPGKNARSVQRFAGIKKNLDEIASNSESKSLFFGTSVFQFFLSPAHFDSRLKQLEVESKSYNLAFEGLLGPGQVAFLSRLENEFNERHAKFRCSIFELSPTGLSRRFNDWHREMLDFVLPSIFLNNSTWAGMFIKDAPGTSYLLFDQFFRPASWTVPYAMGEILGYSPDIMRGKWADIVGLWSNKKYIESAAWNPANAGLSNWNFPETRADFDAAIDLFHQPENWQTMNTLYLQSYDINPKFGFGQRVVEHYIESLNTAAEFSKRTYIVILPYAPSFQQFADKFIDYDFLIKKISATTHASIIDLRQALPLVDADFVDAVHLKHTTMDRMVDLMADRIAADAQNDNLVDSKK